MQTYRVYHKFHFPPEGKDDEEIDFICFRLRRIW